jgi:nucleotide-binding universal stress UspA family protein
MTTVVAALDNSAVARSVLATAQALAPMWDANVVALHVIDDGSRTAHGAADVAHVAREEVHGDVVEQLLARARAEDVAAVVVGARASAGGRAPAGHIALELIGRCHQPIVVVPPNGSPGTPRRVLVALEGREESSRVLEPFFGWAQHGDVEVLAVHVEEEANLPRFSDQVQHETAAFTDEFLARHAPISAPDPRLELRVGRPAEQALAVADEMHADLLAVAWSRRLEPGHARFVRFVLEHSPIPVLLVPTPER